MFGKVVMEFAFIDHRANLKLRLQPVGTYYGVQPVGTYYGVALMLTNAHSCLYGNVTASHFLCMPPTLEEYFEVNVV